MEHIPKSNLYNFISLTVGAENKSVRFLSTENELQSITEESDSSDEDEETTKTRCYVSLQERKEIFAFLQEQFCER